MESSLCISMGKKKSQHKRYVSFLFNKAFNNIVSNYIISNYVPNETVTFNNRDPPWVNKNATLLILGKSEMQEKYVEESKNPNIFDKVKKTKTPKYLTKLKISKKTEFNS